ncbi:MAG: potassium transporter TrkG [Bacteroidales bacterium]
MATKNLNRLLFFSSLIFLIDGLAFIFCIPFALYYHESYSPFLLPGLVLLSFGLLFYIYTNQKVYQIKNRYHELVIFVYSWGLLILIGTIPYFISNTFPNFIDIIFETISGYTTTGTTTINDIEGLPKSIIIYRSITQWIGGIAAITTAVIILPRLNLGGYKLFTSETFKQDHSIKHITITIVRFYS